MKNTLAEVVKELRMVTEQVSKSGKHLSLSNAYGNASNEAASIAPIVDDTYAGLTFVKQAFNLVLINNGGWSVGSSEQCNTGKKVFKPATQCINW